MSQLSFRSKVVLGLAIFSVGTVNSCTVEASRNSKDHGTWVSKGVGTAPVSKGATIEIQPNSPADTVRAFYKNLREKRFREAIFLTNLRPAVEGLTDAELKEFQVDFEAIAKHVPAEIEINGEIITGDSAIVTAKLPDEDLEKTEIQEIKLRSEKGVWVILTVDEEAEKRIRLEGKNYFNTLRIETHEGEAKAMLERISKAQLAYSLQNQGKYAEIPVLIEAGLLPADISSSESTGYVYAITLTDDKSKFSATATPAVYGKSGRLSYYLEKKGKGLPVVSGKDNKGLPIKK